MLSTYNSSSKEVIIILIGGVRKAKDGLIPKRERCQYFG
jgi:hypothetical protein